MGLATDAGRHATAPTGVRPLAPPSAEADMDSQGSGVGDRIFAPRWVYGPCRRAKPQHPQLVKEVCILGVGYF